MSAEEAQVQEEIQQQEGQAEGQTEEQGSLLASNDPFPEAVYGKRGDDGRPEKVPEKYWKDGKVEWPSVLEERNFLASKLGAFKGAPKDGYKLPEVEGVQEWHQDDPMLSGFLDLAAKNNASQEFVDQVLGFWAKSVMPDPAEMQQAREAEMQKLGRDADKRLQDLNDFLFASLDKPLAQALAGAAVNAEVVQAIEALVNKVKPHRLPRDGGPNPSGYTPETLQKMRFQEDGKGNILYEVSAEHRKKVDQAYKDFYGE